MDEHGKRVSWVELYLDLIFVLAVGQLSHFLVEEPETRSVWVALGLFMTMWWTWIGFAVLYNRRGEDVPQQRMMFLIGSIPAGVAAVALGPASHGDTVPLAISLALVRVVLAGANASNPDLVSRRTGMAYLVSAAMFALSVAIPEPYRYLVWAIAIAGESGQLLNQDRDAVHRARHERDWDQLKPTDPQEALDAHHFAERFGLFLIILLGEVVVEAGQGAEHAGWFTLATAMVLAGALWWIYFDAAAEVNMRVLDLSGGSPTMARAIFAVGHMVPAFSLLVIAGGIGSLMEAEESVVSAYWFACIGFGAYLCSTRVFFGPRWRVLRVLLVIAIFSLGRWHEHLTGEQYVWLIAGLSVVCAAIASTTSISALLSRVG